MRVEPLDFPIVCLAGSAGALCGYRNVLRSVRPRSGIAFIVVAHQRPGFDHLLGPLLQAVTTMPVRTITHAQRIEPNAVVMLPAGHDVRLAGGRLLLSAPEKKTGWPITITKFLESLAVEGRTRAVAVILSGLSNDGSAALGAIRAGGGRNFAQADALWPEMPAHAIATGFVDFVLSSEDIGRVLSRQGPTDNLA